MTARGLFITFEGIDGSGKSTQLDLAAEALQRAGRTVVKTRNPGGTDFGLKLREILLHKQDFHVHPTSELLLFIADRAQHMDEVVLPAVERGDIVLCDRHGDSTLAYQGYGRDLDRAMITQLNTIATRGHKPDLTLLFDGAVEALARRVNHRGESDRMEREAVAFHQRVREGYLSLAQAESERFHVFDALKPVDILHQEVMQVFQDALVAAPKGQPG